MIATGAAWILGAGVLVEILLLFVRSERARKEKRRQAIRVRRQWMEEMGFTPDEINAYCYSRDEPPDLLDEQRQLEAVRELRRRDKERAEDGHS